MVKLSAGQPSAPYLEERAQQAPIEAHKALRIMISSVMCRHFENGVAKEE